MTLGSACSSAGHVRGLGWGSLRLELCSPGTPAAGRHHHRGWQDRLGRHGTQSWRGQSLQEPREVSGDRAAPEDRGHVKGQPVRGESSEVTDKPGHHRRRER